MTEATDPDAERLVAGRDGMRRAVGVGVLAGGLAALVVAQLLPTAPARADGLPDWVRIATGALILFGVGAVVMPLWRARRRSPWTDSRVAFGLGAALLGAWAVVATIADIRSGLPGPAIPLLAVGCVAVLVAAVLLAVGPPPPWYRGFGARQALPAAVGLVTVAAVATVLEVVAPWIPVNATTAERVEPATVPDPAAGVRWTSAWSLPTVYRDIVDSVEVVAAGTGVVVANDDRIVAIDGTTGAERWHYRRAGAHISSIAATPDGRTIVATMDAGGTRSSSVLFAFDANTGDVRWSWQPGYGYLATDHALIRGRFDGTIITIFGVDLASGEEIWSWKPPSDCESNGELTSPYERGTDTVLVPVICGDPAGARSYALIGVDDRSGMERWRFTGPTVTRWHPPDAKLITSPDGRVAMYESYREDGRHAPEDRALLDSATGAVLYRTDSGSNIIGLDQRTPVLRREVPGAAAQLVLRDVSTGAEHPLGTECPALQRPDRPGHFDELSSLVRTVVTPSSVLVLCFEGRPGMTPRATIDVYSRSDGTRTATLTATDAVGPITDASRILGLIAAPGAVVLVVQDWDRTSATVVGLT